MPRTGGSGSSCGAVLALLALWVLAFAEDRYAAFQENLTAVDFGGEWDTGMWLAWIAPTIGTGFLFGLATWLPLAKVRYLWSRLLLAALALAPIAKVWWLFFEGHAAEIGWRWLYHADWLFADLAQSALAVLAGVAIASGFRTVRSAEDEE